MSLSKTLLLETILLADQQLALYKVSIQFINLASNTGIKTIDIGAA